MHRTRSNCCLVFEPRSGPLQRACKGPENNIHGTFTRTHTQYYDTTITEFRNCFVRVQTTVRGAEDVFELQKAYEYAATKARPTTYLEWTRIVVAPKLDDMTCCVLGLPIRPSVPRTRSMRTRPKIDEATVLPRCAARRHALSRSCELQSVNCAYNSLERWRLGSRTVSLVYREGVSLRIVQRTPYFIARGSYGWRRLETYSRPGSRRSPST